jgi:hypothetical protein
MVLNLALRQTNTLYLLSVCIKCKKPGIFVFVYVCVCVWYWGSDAGLCICWVSTLLL